MMNEKNLPRWRLMFWTHMIKSLSTLALCAITVTACAVEDSNFRSLKYGARAYPHDGVVFEVVPPIGSTRAAYWCAGAEFARRFLGAGWQTPFYVVRGPGTGEISGRSNSVLFSLDPVGAQALSNGIFQFNGLNTGSAKTVQSADTNCDPFLLDLF
jgi:hypothetical protein